MSALDAHFTVSVGQGARAFSVTADLTLESGVLVLFGPSGSGKSMTLQAIAGHLRPDRGTIQVNGRTLFGGSTDLPPHTRRLGFVPQHHALFPFCDVIDNVAFGLPRRRRRRDNPRVLALIDELGLGHLATARPESLSGGERQRVALARALAVEPDLLLLDEPFASIDQQGRAELRATLRETLGRHGTPAVFITHSVDEALEVADLLTLYERGGSNRTGAPRDLLGRPAPVVLRAQVHAHTDDGAGRVRVDLESATLTGPAELIQPDADGHLALELQAGPTDPA